MDTADSFGERFWKHVCAYKPIWFGLLGVNVILLALAAFSLVFGSYDEYTRGIMILNLLIIGPTTVLCLYVVYRCSTRDV
ncbi:hypothetical protein AArcS_2187 [Natranaeroarchaeum sulfidigenes]|uniref:Uncharacterized protein n=1 Tax=Natranaeroarchaeum sulfidigenes TaxID=2784880 RepID=A0A897MS45_9EURY|nr:hypothetical protein AArcS_2187 [Natranaeroarchaeum sulfidigenes]